MKNVLKCEKILYNDFIGIERWKVRNYEQNGRKKEAGGCNDEKNGVREI